MKDKYFLDTNIIVYSFDSSDTSKQKIAMGLIHDALDQQKGCISYQVIQEFLNVATRKFSIPLTFADSQIYLTTVLDPICEVFAAISLYHQALEIMNSWKFSFYDSLKVGSALQAECGLLYSEDLQHGQQIYNLRIINPFI